VKNRSMAIGLALLATIVVPGTPSFAQDRGDPLYQSGARNIGPPAREDLEGLDALARAKASGEITACADPYNFPYSMSNTEPPGFDVEIFRAIAKHAGLSAKMYWADTGTRGGLGRALRNSISQKKCSLFLGLSTGGDEDEIKENRLVFSKPYMGVGYALFVTGKAKDVTGLDQLRERKMKIGVSMSTPMDDYLFSNGYDRELYFQNKRVLEGMSKGEVDASMVWVTAAAEAQRDFPALDLHLAPNFVPLTGLRWNLVIAVPAKETEFKKFIDDSIDELLKSGEIKRIVESYKVPFYPPFM
jgi:ABC-type amino acid transport substrate-binding protein